MGSEKGMSAEQFWPCVRCGKLVEEFLGQCPKCNLDKPDPCPRCGQPMTPVLGAGYYCNCFNKQDTRPSGEKDAQANYVRKLEGELNLRQEEKMRAEGERDRAVKDKLDNIEKWIEQAGELRQDISDLIEKLQSAEAEGDRMRAALEEAEIFLAHTFQGELPENGPVMLLLGKIAAARATPILR